MHYIALLFMLALCGSGRAVELPDSVTLALQQTAIPIDAIGIDVREAGATQAWIAINSTRALAPASLMKLVTTSAALALLGPTFKWTTRVYANGKLEAGVLHGDLIIEGGGDPALQLERFWLLLRQIRAQGIHDIRGNLLLDRHAFSVPRFDAAAFDGDPVKPYNALPDALLLNHHSLQFRFNPDSEFARVNVSAEPPLDGYTITPPLLSSGACEADWSARLQPRFNGLSVRFDGSYAAACGSKTWYAHQYQFDAADYFAAAFRQFWREAGGSFDGAVLTQRLPADARLLLDFESPPLADVIRDINKFSNNVMARQLLLTLALGTNQGATPVAGAAAIQQWLAALGIAAPELVIENGSGLSRSERIAASSLAHILSAAYASPLMPEFLASLPLVGQDGTMRKRLPYDAVAGNAHIKTGQLDNVKAIAGYVRAHSGKYYVMVFIVNHLNAGRAQAAQDALLKWIYQNG